MLSRVADNIYWMGRYLERAEHTARVMGVHWNLMLENDPRSAEDRWTRVMKALSIKPFVVADVFHAAQSAALNEMLQSVASARENARQVREQISSEMWEQVNRLYHDSRRMGVLESFLSQPHDLVFMTVQACHLFNGITDATMTHGEGWQFVQAGRFIERVQATTRLLESHFTQFYQANAGPMTTPDSIDHMEWIGLLRCCTAFEAYCKVYTAELRPERVAEFLLLNPDFPHSIRFGVDRLRGALESVQSVSGARKPGPLGKLAGRLTSQLSYTPLEEIMGDLREFCVNIRKLCGQIHSGLYQTYITYPIESALEV